MRKLLSVLMLLTLTVPAAAENILFSFGKLNLLLPLANVDAVYLWDTVEQRGLAGAETKVWEYRKLSGTIGAVSDVDLQGTPFVGLQVPLDAISRAFAVNMGGEGVLIGIWGGYNFHTETKMGGIKASVKLW